MDKKKLSIFGPVGDKRHGGWTNSIIIRDGADQRKDNTCYTLVNFELPKGVTNPRSKDACKAFAGANKYQVAEIEVYKVLEKADEKDDIKKEVKKK